MGSRDGGKCHVCMWEGGCNGEGGTGLNTPSCASTARCPWLAAAHRPGGESSSTRTRRGRAGQAEVGAASPQLGMVGSCGKDRRGCSPIPPYGFRRAGLKGFKKIPKF